MDGIKLVVTIRGLCESDKPYEVMEQIKSAIDEEFDPDFEGDIEVEILEQF